MVKLRDAAVDSLTLVGTDPTTISDLPDAGNRRLVVDDTFVLGLLDDLGIFTPIDTGGGGGSTIDVLHYQDQKAQNTSGGTFTSGAWQTRVINTEVSDLGSHGSLSSNQITLAAGTYIVNIRCPAYQVVRHQARLYDITNSAVLLLGSSGIAGGDSGIDQTDSIIKGVIVLAGSTVVEVQHRCESTYSTQGFGVEANLTTEIYTDALFEKIA